MKWLAALVLGLSFIAGFAWIGAFQSEDQQIVSISRGGRDPAAIRKVYDFSGLDGSELSEASKKRLISGFEVTREGENIGLRLGHFVISSASGQKVFACDHYDRVILSFEGEGVAVNGDKPAMEIEGPCSTDQDVNRISPLWIPVARLSGETLDNSEPDRSDVKLRFSRVSEEWPAHWVLVKVKLRNQQDEEVTIEQTELRELLDRPVVISR